MPKPIQLLFIKSGIANRQGLSLTPLIDSRGHPTKRWKKDDDGDWRDEENWHTRTMKRMRTLPDESLRYIIKDATEAARALESHGTESANRKAGQYQDEAHYAGMELRRRQQGGEMTKSDIANRPGLALQNVTDKAGHQTKRWKRTAQEMKAPKPVKGPEAQAKQKDSDPEDRRGSARGYGTHDIQVGGRAKFKAGEHAGQGEITAVGKDGVTIKDSEGREHGIHHHELTHYAPSEEQRGGGQQPPSKPPVSTGGEGQAEQQEPKKPSTVLGKQDPIPAESFVAADYAKSHDQADVTEDSIIAGFPTDTKDRIKAAQDRLEGIEETITKNQKDGAWTEERHKLHDQIQDQILSDEVIRKATPKAGEKPKFILLGGRGGSGKSSFAGTVYDPETSVVLDADHIKSLLPEYEGWNAAQVHTESGEIFDKLVETARALGLNVVLDKTMKTAKSAVADVQAFKDAGYRTEAHYMHLPRQEAAKRAVSRFLNGGEKGRYVPVDVVLSNTTNEDAFDQVKGMVDAWSFRDNNVPKGGQPILISESGDNKAASGDSSKNVMKKSFNPAANRRIIPLLFRRK